MDRARLAVVLAVLAVDRGVDFREQGALGGFREAIAVARGGEVSGGGVGGQEVGASADEGGEGGGHFGGAPFHAGKARRRGPASSGRLPRLCWWGRSWE